MVKPLEYIYIYIYIDGRDSGVDAGDEAMKKEVMMTTLTTRQ
jgi:hypothetical protein